MKVVINRCFGGFSLSALAVKRMAELQGKECYFFSSCGPSGSLEMGKYFPISLEQAEEDWLFSAFSVPDPEAATASDKDWHDMTMDERKAHNARYEAVSLSQRPDDRAHPLLVQVVEELGEKANGRCAELSVVEIPDGTDYEIDEYDGNEHIAEKHRTWR